MKIFIKTMIKFSSMIIYLILKEKLTHPNFKYLLISCKKAVINITCKINKIN